MPEMLPPTRPSKPSIFSATPYSVTEVPRMGMSAVAVAAACSAGVAFAMMRSTSSETKVFIMVEQVLESPAAFCSSNTTFSSPSSAITASLKPWVAASSASWVISWQMPMVYLPSSPPQAVMLRIITSAKASAINFFIFFSPFHFPIHGEA